MYSIIDAIKYNAINCNWIIAKYAVDCIYWLQLNYLIAYKCNEICGVSPFQKIFSPRSRLFVIKVSKIIITVYTNNIGLCFLFGIHRNRIEKGNIRNVLQFVSTRHTVSTHPISCFFFKLLSYFSAKRFLKT